MLFAVYCYQLINSKRKTQNRKHCKMKKIKVTQVRSVIDRPGRQKRTMVALGLNKMNASVEVEATPQILGMVRKVNHLISVVELA